MINSPSGWRKVDLLKLTMKTQEDQNNVCAPSVKKISASISHSNIADKNLYSLLESLLCWSTE